MSGRRQSEAAPLTPSQRRGLRDQLLAIRAEASERSRLAARRALARETCPVDAGDVARQMRERAFGLSMVERDRRLLEQVDEALSRIDTDDYGVCEGTGEPIPYARLALRPWARHTAAYQSQLEREA